MIRRKMSEPKRGFLSPRAKKVAYIGLIIGVIVAIYGLGYGVGWWGSVFQPPTEEGPLPPSPIEGVNATLFIQYPGETDEIGIAGFTEVQLWKTWDRYNISTWTQVNIEGNWTGTDFYHTDSSGGWLNGAMFNYNLSTTEQVGTETVYLAWYVKIRAWHMLSEWIEGSYTPPISFYPWYWIFWPPIAEFIEEGETALTWARISNGINVIELVSEPYTSYLKIEDSTTFLDWDSSNGAYPDNSTANYDIRINLPLNESKRGYREQYDWLNEEYNGLWLVASSNDSNNIYRNYTDVFGNNKLSWFNVTSGFLYRGVLFNDSITSWGLYDVAILLKSFTGNYEFQANIGVWNGSAGMNWFLAKGSESNIQIFRSL